MTIAEVVATMGAVCGFLASLAFVIGSARITEKQIRDVTVRRLDGINAAQAYALADQKADYMSGTILLAASFTAQVAALVGPERWQEAASLCVYALATSVVMFIAIASIAFQTYVRSTLRERVAQVIQEVRSGQAT